MSVFLRGKSHRSILVKCFITTCIMACRISSCRWAEVISKMGEHWSSLLHLTPPIAAVSPERWSPSSTALLVSEKYRWRRDDAPFLGARPGCYLITPGHSLRPSGSSWDKDWVCSNQPLQSLQDDIDFHASPKRLVAVMIRSVARCVSTELCSFE